MRDQRKLLTGLALGAGAMYLLDPDRGGRRRALLRDRSARAGRVIGEGVGTAARDVRNRSAGAAAAVRSRLQVDQAGDEIIQERVRAALGRAVSHPGAVQTAVFDGRLFLSGPVLADELGDLLAAVRRVRGVREVENQLQVHESPDSVPGLQGAGRRPAARAQAAQQGWSPTMRVVVGLAGAALAAQGARGRGALRKALAALGTGLLVRAGIDLPTGRRIGVGAGRRAMRERRERPEDRRDVGQSG